MKKIKKNYIGIFQGRLTDNKKNILQHYPKNWEKEILHLKKIDYDYLEFFLEKKINLNNSFWKKTERIKINNYASNFNNRKFILCDNYVLINSFSKKKTINYLNKVMNLMSIFKKKKLILPFDEKIKNLNEKTIMNNINKIVNKALRNKIEISFETDDFPEYLVNFIKKKIIKI